MIGDRLGPYKILEQLGKGGMGEVWLAEDTRLERKVAVKVLPAELAADSDRRQRFEQEAKAAAALNHPHIAAVHDVGVEGQGETARHYMVQEYLQGETLREALNRGPFPRDRALSLTQEIAEGLRAAHQAGIVHRDLKPENIFLTRDGHVKVLDFGLAKLTEMSLSPDAGPSMSPTLTMAGQIMGTAGYMSPEQVKGEVVDARTDLFSLGCLLYEMMTGKRAFGGGNVHESLSRILSHEPDAVGPDAGGGPLFDWLLAKLLAKDRDSRYQTAAEVVVDLRRLADGAGPAPVPAAKTAVPAAPPARRAPWAAAALLVTVAVLSALGTWAVLPTAEPAAPLDARFEILLPSHLSFSSNYNRVVTISPDGRTIGYTAEAIWLRSLGDTQPLEIPNTRSARAPAFSPDSEHIAFWESGFIRRVPRTGGTPLTVGELPGRPLGMNWAPDGFIYVGRADQGIWRLPAAGGELEQVIKLKEGELAHGPELLGDGTWLMFTLGRSVRAWSEASIVAQSLESGERKVLVPRGREARLTGSGHLLYVLNATLFAVPFDAGRMVATGVAVAMETDIHTSGGEETGAAGYDISDNGILVFAPPGGFGSQLLRLALIDLDEKVSDLPEGARRYGVTRLSPDGQRVAAQVNGPDGAHIWILSVSRAGVQRLTASGRNTDPVWSPDGRYIYYASYQDGETDIWRRAADLSGPPERVLEAPGAQFPSSISGNGKWLAYMQVAPGNSDLGRLSLDDGTTTEMLLESPADEQHGRLSPDGKFLCFMSDETGSWNIHMLEIASGRRWIISTQDAINPLWSRDGRSILFTRGAHDVHRVQVKLTPAFSAGEPEELLRISANLQASVYDVTVDAQQILIGTNAEGDAGEETRPRITVVMNGFDRINQRAGGSTVSDPR